MAVYDCWKQWMLDGSKESLPGMPILELAGDGRILIERHEGVIEYGEERIQILMHYGVLCIDGNGLCLQQMSKQQLVVTGAIDAIKIQRR